MGFFSSGFGRILAGVGTMGMSEALRIPGMAGAIGTGVGTSIGGPVGGAIGGALGSSAQSLLGGGSKVGDDAMWGAWMQNQASAAQAQKQMDFQERMSNTAHQREVADLRSAGLNPILSGTGGHGSTTPAGASAPQVDIMSGKVSTALKLSELSNQTAQVMSQIALNATSATKNLSESQSTQQDTILKQYQNLGIDRELDYYKAGIMSGPTYNIDKAYSAKHTSTIDMYKADMMKVEQEKNNYLLEITKKHNLQEDEKLKLLKGDVKAQLATLTELENRGTIAKSDIGLFLTFLERMVGIGVKLNQTVPR